MAEPNSSAPLLTSRGSNNGTQVLSTPNVRAADTNAANKAMGSSKDGQKPRKRKVSYYISPIVKSAAWIKAGWTKSTHAISRFWKRSWTAETCGFTLSVLCLGGLIATLLTHQNKPQPKWPRFITINAVVSLFSLLMRTGVSVVLSEGISQSRWQWFRKARPLDDAERFDAASRGPWGSFLLLCNMRPKRAYYIAALGAFTTIMTALTGFFSQQLLQFENCPQQNDAADVLVAKTNNYTVSGRFAGARNTYDVYAPVVAAITVGLVQPVKDFTNVFTRGCDSGNCTFPSSLGASFSTVAISHVCEDISGLLRQTNRTTKFDEFESYSVLGGGSLNIRKNAVMSTSTTATRRNGPSVSTITLLYRTHFEANDTKGINCTLFPTVNTYKVEIKDTRLEETLIRKVPFDIHYAGNVTNAAGAEVTETGDNGSGIYLYSLASNQTLRNGVSVECTGSKDPGPGLVGYFKTKTEYTNQLGLLERTSLRWYYPADCLWFIGKGAVKGMEQHFAENFYDQEMTAARALLTSGNMYLRALWNAEEPIPSAGNSVPDVVGRISFESVDEAFRNVARAITAYMRTHGEEGLSGYAKGHMWSTATCVYTRWEWIVFPAAMIGLTGIFLALVMIENWGNDSERLWKSSILATLFCDVDVQQDRPVGKEQMKESAKSTSVSLESKSGELRLVAR